MMLSRNHIALFLFLFCSFTTDLFAQEPLNRNWDSEKIKGVRSLPYPSYKGFAYMSNTWDPGKIEFTDGEIRDSLYLRYSSYKDEVVYFNKENSSQIVIDKDILKGFSFTEKNGMLHRFKKLPFDDYLKSDRFFEILSEGETDLLVFRKVITVSTTPYKDMEKGPLKNMEYVQAYQYYFYSPEKGYTPIRLTRTGLQAKFDKPAQKQIKKILRKNRIKVTDEYNLVRAWKTIENLGFGIHY
ncbi:MAG: hypothetical protein WAO52_05185 [Prolixibacteraceae bacterium]